MKVQRYKCKNKDCDYDRQEHIPFATDSYGYTQRFAKYAVGLLKAMTLKEATSLLREFGIRNIKKVEVVVYSPYVQVMVPAYSRRNNMQQVPSIDSL